VKFGLRLARGRFVARRNLFLADVEIEGRVTPCFLPNPGRLPELLVPGAEALVARPAPAARPAGAPPRTTAHDLVALRYGGRWVSVDTRLPNALFREAHGRGRIAELADTTIARAEHRHGASRFDYLLTRAGRPLLLEIKSVSLCEDGVALFPDAPTVRGTKHLRELTAARREGILVCALFCIQRPDARVLRPHDATDPAFGAALREAHAAGVELLAYGCRTDAARIAIAAPVPLELPRLTTPRPMRRPGAPRAAGTRRTPPARG
jgi:sugar fermentation stimulation protein A